MIMSHRTRSHQSRTARRRSPTSCSPASTSATSTRSSTMRTSTRHIDKKESSGAKILSEKAEPWWQRQVASSSPHRNLYEGEQIKVQFDWKTKIESYARAPAPSQKSQMGLQHCSLKQTPSSAGTPQAKACTESPPRSARTCCWRPAGGFTPQTSVTRSTSTTPPSLPQTLDTAAPSILTSILTSTMGQMPGTMSLLMAQRMQNSQVSN